METRMKNAMNVLKTSHKENITADKIELNKFTFPSIDASDGIVEAISYKNYSPKLEQTDGSVTTLNNFGQSLKGGLSGIITPDPNLIYHNSNNADLASVNSSDTFISCQTHRSYSQTDLDDTAGDEETCNLDIDELFKSANKSLSGKMSRGNSLYTCENISDRKIQVKKSTSGDTALHKLGSNSIDDECGSRVSLDDPPLPKHRKTRFQHKQADSCNKSFSRTFLKDIKDSRENIDSTENRKHRKTSFIPTKIIKATTKQLISQHLFGIQIKGLLMFAFGFKRCTKMKII